MSDDAIYVCKCLVYVKNCETLLLYGPLFPFPSKITDMPIQKLGILEQLNKMSAVIMYLPGHPLYVKSYETLANV